MNGGEGKEIVQWHMLVNVHEISLSLNSQVMPSV